VPSTLSVSIDKDGKYFLNAEQLDLEQLRGRIRAAYTKDNDTRAVIAADGRVSHAEVVKIIDLLRQEKVTKFAINVRPEDLAGGKK
jgi:biopolymer transport protein ExbD